MTPPPSKEDLFSLPNLLSLVRVGSIPILVVMIHHNGPYWCWAAGAVFFVAGLTDLADGWLARRMKKVSVLGQYLDPVADKLLIASLLIALVGEGRAPAWMAILVICREIAVTGMRALAAIKGFKVPSDMWGKWKTAVQMLALLLLVMHYPLGGFDPHFWGMAALWGAIFITAWSGLGYFIRFRRELGHMAGR
ncbi:CDP-diacylglycerol--glycerol-3-phosphate 3-phosphatidyltransferase [Desulfocarbo indianensis]|nr:CDP-diacylglycerol--glycerol-3-phosphate 3-phosphatidyltransferase [Desulfocarbo indianensis]